ncbi:TRAP transporter substrate-binding protein [Pontivivens insulae]|uniref:2,3-diketo-L-gulonate-binding periplasmic protein YiaO n=1 Tax=Pontivivens insulae TaxID=1639689 RepID=A0A2R8AA94_9RHOB|nr:TRAP transporter substrate-binding protein [Pontivivens insulae]RED13062.1 TRAP-type C4-dicarboxylate transport system substrate-binding protein [Pontivivens insulae]SPF29154.1 2,3-diketo-L-gulonate-binding periplasmic protein YiaO [Pontivivens insulae]
MDHTKVIAHAAAQTELERRNFLKMIGTSGFTAAVMAATGGMLWSEEAMGQTAAADEEARANAEHIMLVGTAYRIDQNISFPIMQAAFKNNVERLTEGRIYVQLAPDGEEGVGSVLAGKVQRDTIQAAQHSLSNFAPFAPVVDLINLPYLCGANQRFTNLVNSDRWSDIVHPRVNARGFKPLFYVVTNPRTIAVRRDTYGEIRTPDDLRGINIRIPGSETLRQYYAMIGANPVPVAWDETLVAIQQGVVDALDPSVGALHVFGFKNDLSDISFTMAVPDSQVYSCNIDWFNDLPIALRRAIDQASRETTFENLAQVPESKDYAMSEMRAAGVNFHDLTADELAQWEAIGGYTRPEWDDFKIDRAGSMIEFEMLLEAIETPGDFTVVD